MERIASASYAQVVDVEKQCLRLKDDLDYVAFNIGVGLTYTKDLLPPDVRIFYIGFRGPQGAGKSTATAFAAKVAKDGEKLEAVNFATLAAACDEGRTLCVDEVDAQGDRCPELEMIMRQGIALDATYSKMVAADGRGWRRCKIKIGGMKFFNWKDSIDAALMQRVVVIEMAPNATTRMIIHDESMGRFTTPIAIWFAAQSAAVHKRWTQEKVAVLIADEDHHLERKVDALTSIVPRQKQKAFWLLVVCEIFGWDFDDAIKNLIDRQPEGEDYSDYKELVAEVYLQKREWLDVHERSVEVVEMDLLDFKADLTERITSKHLDQLKLRGRPGTLTWVGLRQECGFIKDITEKKVRGKGGKRVLLFDERVQRALGILEEQTKIGGRE
jgi:hypothetical protein